MNLSVFKSLHAVTAAIIVTGFWLWRDRAGLPIGRTPGLSVAFLLWTGWIAFLLYLVLFAYALRKYAHKLRITPEFSPGKVPRREERERRKAACESAMGKLSNVRVRALAGELRTRRSLREAARRILLEEGVSRILAVKVTRSRGPGRPFQLEVENRMPIGRVAKWMHAHIFYGIAAGALVFLHGGFRFENPMAWLLNGLSLLVIATGLVGILLWVFGPSVLTRIEGGLSLEKAFGLREHFARKVAEAEEELLAASTENAESVAPKLLAEARALGGVRSDLASGARVLLSKAPPELKPKLTELVILRVQGLNLAAEWRVRARFRFLLNVWRVVHVPASILLLAVCLVHALSVWWY